MARGSGSGGGKTGSPRLAELISARRRQLGMSRQDLADAAGIPYPTVAQIETAYRGVSPSRLGVIARVLGLDPKELYDLLAADTSESPPEPTPPSTAASRDLQAGSWYANPTFAAPASMSAPRAAPGAAPVAAPSAGRFSSAGLRPQGTVRQSTEGAGSAAPTDHSQPDAVTAKVLELLSSLPADERLDALIRVQRQLLVDLVDEQVRRRRDSEKRPR
jgi:transcriptional regulator with XRE-family HTH domain